MTKTDRTATALRSVAALIAVAVVAPIGLVAAGRARLGSANPLVDVDVPWRWSLNEVRDALAEPLRDDAVVNLLIRGCLVAAWAAVSIVVATTVIEFVHLVRHRGIPAPRVRGLGWAQRSAHFIAAGLIAVLPIASSSAVAAGAGHVSMNTPTASVSPSYETSAAWSPTSEAWSPTSEAWSPTSEAWSPRVGEAAGTEAVRRLPVVGGFGADGRPDAPPGTGDSTGSIETAPGSHLVRRGDSIWSIAESLALGGDDARTMEIADAILDANLGRTMSDGSTFTNPALIRVGWTIVVPVDALGGTTRSAPGSGTNTGIGGGGAGESMVRHVVEPGETLSSIAADHLGDPDRWPTIFEANAGRTMSDGRTLDDADLIVPGWQLEVPTAGASIPFDAAVPDEQVDAPPEEPSTTTPAADAPAVGADHPDSVVDLDDVDHDLDVAATEADVDTARDPDTAATEADVDTAGDPHTAATEADVEPDPDAGQTGADIDVDTARDSDTAATDAAIEADVEADPGVEPADRFDVDDTGDDAASSDGSRRPELGPSAPTAAGAPLPRPTGAPTRGTSTPAAATTTTTSPPVVPGDADARPAGGSESPEAPSPLRLEHAAFLAAGVLALVGVRRRRRLRAALPRARVPAPRADVVRIERRLRSLAPGDIAMRLDIALRAAAPALADQGVAIGLVRLGPDGEVALRLTGPARLSEPWQGLGTDWELAPAVPIELLTEEARRSGAPCAALGEIGIDRAGRRVLVDVEAAGLLAIQAPHSQADEVIRALTMSLASSLHAEVAHLVAVGLDEAVLLGHPNAHHRASPTEAIDLALALAGSTVDNERTTFDLRTRRTGGEMWEPAIVVLGSAASADSLTGMPEPGHGFGVIVPTTPGAPVPAAGARLTAHADRWELDAFGDRFVLDPIGIEPDDLADITTLLDDADTPIPAEPIDPPSHDATITAPFVSRPHEIVVGLLGGVEIRSRNGEPGRFERSKTVELIAWLATHRERATRTAARTALWEIDVRDATFANVVSEARRALGRLVDPPDGEEWVARTLTESLPLHSHVVTDADLVRDRLDHARLAAPSQAIEVLRPAVELVRDLPFAGTSYLWPDADGITSELVLLATTVTAELAAHALSLGDTDTVFWATGHGLRVLPGHEELIALRMRAHARAGDLAGVRAEWESYERVIIADAWSDGEPAPKLLDLRRELLSP